MSLWTRLIGTAPEPKIPIHAFFSMLSEQRRGQATTQDVIDAFNLSAGEQTELTALWARVNDQLVQAEEVNDVLILAESGNVMYDTEAKVKQRLGVV